MLRYYTGSQASALDTACMWA